jgi:hypothetical protein
VLASNAGRFRSTLSPAVPVYPPAAPAPSWQGQRLWWWRATPQLPAHLCILRPARCARGRCERWHLQYAGVDLFVDDASFDPPVGAGGGAGTNELRAPFNGKVIAVNVKAGDAVSQGDCVGGGGIHEARTFTGRCPCGCGGQRSPCRPGNRWAPGRCWSNWSHWHECRTVRRRGCDDSHRTAFCRVRNCPHINTWDEAGSFPRGLYGKAASVGLLGLGYPEALGGTPAPFALRNAVSVTLARVRWQRRPHGQPVFAQYRLAARVALWLGGVATASHTPRCCVASKIAALGITEPGCGSDVAGLRTTARLDGNEWVINGEKVFITSGMRADWITVGCTHGRSWIQGRRRHLHDRRARRGGLAFRAPS